MDISRFFPFTLSNGAIIGVSSTDISNGVLVHQTGTIIFGDNVHIGAGAIIARGSDKDNPTIIGNNVSIAPGVSIGHSAIIQDDCVLLGCCQISGYAIIKKKSEIGPSACVRNRCIVGEGSILGQGAVLTKDMPDGEIWVGNPARFLETIEDRIQKRIEINRYKEIILSGTEVTESGPLVAMARNEIERNRTVLNIRSCYIDG